MHIDEKRNLPSRRELATAALAAAAAPRAYLAAASPRPDSSKARIRIGNALPGNPSEQDLQFFKQLGIECASVRVGLAEATYEFFSSLKARLEREGIDLFNIGVIDLHADPVLVLGLPGREEQIERYKAYLTNLSRAGIRYTTYAHMANIKMAAYYQTGVTTTRGGASAREFDAAVAARLPLSHGRTYSEEEIWEGFRYFIRAVMPTADRVGVRIGLHPDDPPLPSLGGVARILRNFEGLRRAIEMADSDNCGICLCVGTWAEGGSGTGRDVYDTIRYFGQRGRLFKVHFRNVDRPLPHFQETFVDDGYIDMPRVMSILGETRFDGVLIPDHVPGWSQINTAYTIGYMKALRRMCCNFEKQ